jgi:ABC-type transport system involved in multi-copper enzyme maturation permease subunit
VSTPGIFDSVLQNPDELLYLIFRTGNLFCVVLGVIVIGAEYGSSTIFRTYQHFSDRTSAVLGKLICLAGFSLVSSLFASVVGILILNLSGIEAFVILHPLALIGYYVANCIIMTILSFSVTLISSRTIPALLAMITLIYILPDILKTIFSFFSPGLVEACQYLPADALGAGVRMSILGEQYSGINPLAGVAVTCVVGLVVLFLGNIIQRRRDL